MGLSQEDTKYTIKKSLNVAVIVKLEPDFSEVNITYNSDGTLNRAETKNMLLSDRG